MRTVNTVTLLGNVARSPEMRTTSQGKQFSTFVIATHKDSIREGGKITVPEFHNIVAWGKRGEVIGQYVVKGQELFVEGRLETRNWEDKDTGKKMYRTEIILDNFEFGAKAGAGGQSQGSGYNNQKNTNSTPAAAPQQPKEEEIPTINLDDEADEVKIEDVPF